MDGWPVGQPGPDSLAEHLRDAYARRLLRPAGRTADGSLRLRGGPVLGGSPREVSITGSPASCGTSRAPTDQEVWLITRAASLPATAANRRLLAVADWPTLRAVRWAGVGRPGTPVHHVPPVPALDEG